MYKRGSQNIVYRNGKIKIVSILFLIVIILKLLNIITINWWLTLLLPIIIILGGSAIISILFGLFICIMFLLSIFFE
jgi:hypothetical protein